MVKAGFESMLAQADNSVTIMSALKQKALDAEKVSEAYLEVVHDAKTLLSSYAKTLPEHINLALGSDELMQVYQQFHVCLLHFFEILQNLENRPAITYGDLAKLLKAGPKKILLKQHQADQIVSQQELVLLSVGYAMRVFFRLPLTTGNTNPAQNEKLLLIYDEFKNFIYSRAEKIPQPIPLSFLYLQNRINTYLIEFKNNHGFSSEAEVAARVKIACDTRDKENSTSSDEYAFHDILKLNFSKDYLAFIFDDIENDDIEALVNFHGRMILQASKERFQNSKIEDYDYWLFVYGSCYVLCNAFRCNNNEIFSQLNGQICTHLLKIQVDNPDVDYVELLKVYFSSNAVILQSMAEESFNRTEEHIRHIKMLWMVIKKFAGKSSSLFETTGASFIAAIIANTVPLFASAENGSTLKFPSNIIHELVKLAVEIGYDKKVEHEGYKSFEESVKEAATCLLEMFFDLDSKDFNGQADAIVSINLMMTTLTTAEYPKIWDKLTELYRSITMKILVSCCDSGRDDFYKILEDVLKVYQKIICLNVIRPETFKSHCNAQAFIHRMGARKNDHHRWPRIILLAMDNLYNLICVGSSSFSCVDTIHQVIGFYFENSETTHQVLFVMSLVSSLVSELDNTENIDWNDLVEILEKSLTLISEKNRKVNQLFAAYAKFCKIMAVMPCPADRAISLLKEADEAIAIIGQNGKKFSTDCYLDELVGDIKNYTDLVAAAKLAAEPKLSPVKASSASAKKKKKPNSQQKSRKTKTPKIKIVSYDVAAPGSQSAQVTKVVEPSMGDKLRSAVRELNFDLVGQMLDTMRADDINSYDSHSGETALHLVCSDEETCKKLLLIFLDCEKVDLSPFLFDKREERGVTPLKRLVGLNLLELTHRLIDNPRWRLQEEPVYTEKLFSKEYNYKGRGIKNKLVHKTYLPIVTKYYQTQTQKTPTQPQALPVVTLVPAQAPDPVPEPVSEPVVVVEVFDDRHLNQEALLVKASQVSVELPVLAHTENDRKLMVFIGETFAQILTDAPQAKSDADARALYYLWLRLFEALVKLSPAVRAKLFQAPGEIDFIRDLLMHCENYRLDSLTPLTLSALQDFSAPFTLLGPERWLKQLAQYQENANLPIEKIFVDKNTIFLKELNHLNLRKKADVPVNGETYYLPLAINCLKLLNDLKFDHIAFADWQDNKLCQNAAEILIVLMEALKQLAKTNVDHKVLQQPLTQRIYPEALRKFANKLPNYSRLFDARPLRNHLAHLHDVVEGDQVAWRGLWLTTLSQPAGEVAVEDQTIRLPLNMVIYQEVINAARWYESLSEVSDKPALMQAYALSKR